MHVILVSSVNIYQNILADCLSGKFFQKQKFRLIKWYIEYLQKCIFEYYSVENVKEVVGSSDVLQHSLWTHPGYDFSLTIAGIELWQWCKMLLDMPSELIYAKTCFYVKMSGKFTRLFSNLFLIYFRSNTESLELVGRRSSPLIFNKCQ